jgi:hypothetical protein
MEMFYVNIFLSSLVLGVFPSGERCLSPPNKLAGRRGAVRLFLFTGQLSKDQVDIKKESFCHGSTRIVPGHKTPWT